MRASDPMMDTVCGREKKKTKRQRLCERCFVCAGDKLSTLCDNHELFESVRDGRRNKPTSTDVMVEFKV